MNHAKLLLRSLVHYRRTHAGVILAMAISTAIVVGALLIGDSVRISLRDMALARLGKTHTALATGERFFRTELADELSDELHIGVAPVLQVRGLATARGGEARVNRVQVLGVDQRFWALSHKPLSFASLPEDEVVVSHVLAARLALKPGDTIVLRIDKPGLLARDDPLASASDVSAALRVKIGAIAGLEQLGGFSLHSSQVPPFNVFLPLSRLAKAIDRPGRANMLLVTDGATTDTIRKRWTLADAALELRPLTNGRGPELRSPRVFLEPAILAAAERASQGVRQIFTYLVNDIGHGERHCPYAFVSAPGDTVVPPGMADDRIILNSWLAEDLEAKAGDAIELSYYVHDARRTLVETSRVFRVEFIVPLEGNAYDPDLMPAFPGIADTEGCRDWDSGIAIDTARIRDLDEAYWKQYRGTPKAFVTLDAAQAMWQNRFGILTALRFPGDEPVDLLGSRILRHLDPSALGFSFRPVREQALQGARDSQDMGSLFLSLSFFLLVAALLLVALLFVFSVEQRSQESGILLALGYTPRRVRWILLAEGTVLALVGAWLGLPLGILYNQVILQALTTVWRDAVGTPALSLHIIPATLAKGVVGAVIISIMTLALTLRKQARKPIHELQAGRAGMTQPLSARSRRLSLILAVLCAAGAVGVIATTSPGRGKEAAGAFFSAGSLLLVAGLAFANALLTGRPGHRAPGLSILRLGLRNSRRRRDRSLTIIGLLACGIFLAMTVGVNRHEVGHESHDRSSGTGGFALLGETTVPLLQDLNSRSGRQQFDLTDLDDLSFVQLRMREGDDASCLNLNRAQAPRLLALQPDAFAQRKAFTFASLADGVNESDPWLALDLVLEADTIPGIADQTVITWGLGKRVGDTLSYRDEQGRPFKVKLVAGLANSIFQGSVLISEKHFVERFPSITGTRLFVAEMPAGSQGAAAEQLGRSMRDWGLELVSAPQRLMEFYAVENTYLAIFLLLGAMGVLLGTVGLGIVVLRNVLERRAELALLRATGFSRGTLAWLIMSEHAMLLTIGVICGLVAAVVASLPTLLSPGGALPLRSVACLVVGVLVNGLAWTGVASWTATRGGLISALREE